MMSFKRIHPSSSDVVERAKEYRQHEDGCSFCKAARYLLHSDVHRCDKGRMLWTLVFEYEDVDVSV